MTADFSWETRQMRRQWNNLPKIFKGKNVMKCIKTILSSLALQKQVTAEYGSVVSSLPTPGIECQFTQIAISYFSINIFSILFVSNKSTI